VPRYISREGRGSLGHYAAATCRDYRRSKSGKKRMHVEAASSRRPGFCLGEVTPEAKRAPSRIGAPLGKRCAMVASLLFMFRDRIGR